MNEPKKVYTTDDNIKSINFGIKDNNKLLQEIVKQLEIMNATLKEKTGKDLF